MDEELNQGVTSAPIEPAEAVYAPQPQMPESVEQEVTSAPAPSPVLPAETVNTWSQSEPSAPVAVSPAVVGNPFVNFVRKYKKRLIILGSAFLVLVVLSLIGYFGYRYYVNASDSRILQKAAQNVIDGNNMTTEVNVGAMGVSVAAVLDVDKDQNLHFKLKNDLIPMDLYYIKKEDKAYMGSDSYDYSSGLDTTTEPTKTKKYTVYTNVQKAIDSYTSKNLSPSVLAPNKNYFTVDNQKYMKRLADEKQDGKELYKFSFTPDKDYINKTLNEAKKTTDALPFSINDANIKIDFLIDKADYKLYKITGSIKLGVETKDKEAALSSLDLSKIEVTWDQKFSYDFKGKISTPKDGKIESTEDLGDLLDPNVQNSKADDAKAKAEVHEIQTALEQYFVDNNNYPSNLVALKTPPVSDTDSEYASAYLYSDLDLKNYTYKTTGNPPSSYTLSVKLKNQKDSGSNIVGNSPNKLYQVTNKQ